MNYYERHLGDWSKDTSDLSMLEEGAYNRLIDAYYAKEQGIEHERRYLVARAMSAAERKAVDSVLGLYFHREGERWVKGRVEEEIAKAHERIERARKNGAKGGRPAKAKRVEGKPSGKPTGLSVGSPEETQNGGQAKAHHTPPIQLTTTTEASPPHYAPERTGGGGDECGGLIGTFEGHGDPPPRPQQATPYAIAALALRKHGYLDCHPHHPDLIAAVNEGVPIEHIEACAARFAGKGKPGSYAVSTARREHAEGASPLNGGPHGEGSHSGESLLDRVQRRNREHDERERWGGDHTGA